MKHFAKFALVLALLFALCTVAEAKKCTVPIDAPLATNYFAAVTLRDVHHASFKDVGAWVRTRSDVNWTKWEFEALVLEWLEEDQLAKIVNLSTGNEYWALTWYLDNCK